MKSIRNLSRMALAVAGAACFAAPTHALDLTGQGYVQYGDGQSYSLPILALQNCPQPNKCEFKVDSTPGAISSLTVLGTGSSGVPVVTNFDGMDNAYATPSGVSGSTFWRPSLATDQGTQGTVNNNSTDSWDASLSALKTYLTTDGLVEQMIFFFNNNQENGEEQSLAAWASIVVRDPDNTILGRFDFVNKATYAGTPGAYLPIGDPGPPASGGVLLGNTNTYTAPLSDTRSDPNAPFPGTAASTDYVLSGGEICLDAGANPVACSNPLSVLGPINHNLGANEAAYAVMFPELDALLATLWGESDLADYTLSVDIRLGCDPRLDDDALVCTGQAADKDGNGFLYGRNLTNGFEQIFIAKGSAVTIIEVPEPGTLLLAGLALVGLAGLRRRG